MPVNPNTTPRAVMSFPHLFSPRAASPGQEEKYSVTLIFDKAAQETPQYKRMRSEVLRAAKEKWGDKATDMIKNGQLRVPFRSGSEKSEYAGYDDDSVFINMTSKQKPDVLDGFLSDVLPSDCYPGMIGMATYNIYVYVNQSRGVGIGLQNCQIISFDAPRLDGKKKGNQDFDALDDGGIAAGVPGEGNDELADEMPF